MFYLVPGPTPSTDSSKALDESNAIYGSVNLWVHIYLDSIIRTTALWIRFRRPPPLLHFSRETAFLTIAELTSSLSTLMKRKRQSPPKLLPIEQTRTYINWIFLSQNKEKGQCLPRRSVTVQWTSVSTMNLLVYKGKYESDALDASYSGSQKSIVCINLAFVSEAVGFILCRDCLRLQARRWRIRASFCGKLGHLTKESWPYKLG